MGATVSLPIGPQGRIPKAAVKIDVAGQSTTPEAHLVLFEDGTMGVKEERDTSPFPWSRSGNLGYDGSEYMMLYHSTDHLSTIERYSSNHSNHTIFLGLSSIICAIYSVIFIFVQMGQGLSPHLFRNDYFKLSFIVFPLLILQFSPRIIDLNSGQIKIYPSATDPFTFDVPSHIVSTANNLLTISVLGGLGCFIGLEEEWCGPVLLCLLFGTIINHFRPGVFSTPTLFLPKDDFSLPLFNLDDFYNHSIDQVREISQRERIENPELLELLMDNESPTLEFKASLWTQYKGTTDERVPEQQKKNLHLQDAVVKTVAAFMNTDGGTLLIGVLDKPRSSGSEVARVVGVEPDFQWLSKKRADVEGFVHSMHQLLDDAFGNQALVKLHVNITTPIHEGHTICRLDVKPRKRIKNNDVWVKTYDMGPEEFFFRSSDTTVHASAKSAARYIRDTFEHPRNPDKF